MTRRVVWIGVSAVVLLLLVSGGPSWAQHQQAGDEPKPKTVESALHFLTHGEIIFVDVDTDPFVAWIKPILPELEDLFAKEKDSKPRTVVVQVTLHPDRVAEVVAAGQPALSDAEVKAVLAAMKGEKAPRSRIVDCAFRIVLKVRGGDAEFARAGALQPAVETPVESKLARFRAAGTSQKLAIMRRWAIHEAIPLIAAFAAKRDGPKFKAVRAFGKELQGVKPDQNQPADVSSLTEKSPNYWLTMIATPVGDPLAPLARVALHVSRGEIGMACRIVEVVAPFDAKDSGSSYLLDEFRVMSRLFNQEVETRIQKGIALNDQGKFDEAIGVYEGVLKDFPKSPWAIYERFHTNREKAIKAKQSLESTVAGWPEARKAILEADPLYPSMAAASGEDEIDDLVLRAESTTLFKEKGQLPRDLLRYADIVLDLGQPGLASTIYWESLSAFKPEDVGERDLVEDFLYGLERLGVKDIKANFQGDHPREFRRIDDDRAKRKKDRQKGGGGGGGGAEKKAAPPEPRKP
jgi:hypothetical protein